MNKPGEHIPGLIPLYGNYYMQLGRASFTDNATDLNIYTPLTAIKASFATYANESLATAATDGSATLAISSDVSSCAVRIARGATTAGLADLTDASVSFMLIGTVDDTN
uniref:Uncharacterized protein n=1 Tax=viral metagenome TaxID=1070528 RepID=A0A6M3L2X8_9ZZZZ